MSKNIPISLVLTAVLLLFGLFVFMPKSSAQSNLLSGLLDLPAPPPRYGANADVPEAPRKIERGDDFYEKSNVPPDDAPIEDLLAYWEVQARGVQALRYSVKPSKTVVRRILDAVEKEPVMLTAFLKIFPPEPDVAKTVKRLYDKFLDEARNTGDDDDDDEIPESMNIGEVYNAAMSMPDYFEDYSESPDLSEIKTWLTYNSDYFSNDLLEKAEKVKDSEEYVTNQNELLALAAVDWKLAEPIAERLLNDKNQPVSSVLAKWAYYKHSLLTNDNPDINKYRRALQDVVEDKKAQPGARDLAMDALVGEEEWAERDDWYMTLLDDETLYELKVNGSVYTGLTTIVLNSAPDRWVSKMTRLLGSQNQKIHDVAVRNLLSALRQDSNNREVVLALLPLLSDPELAKSEDQGRRALITAVGNGEFPESIPGLIKIVQSDEELRGNAIAALEKYKDPRIVPVLQTALLGVTEPFYRERIIRAILANGGYNVNQQIGFLEDFARFASSSNLAGQNPYAFYSDSSFSQNAHIGMVVSRNPAPDDMLVKTGLLRLKDLKRTDPPTAALFEGIVKNWESPVNDLERLNELGNGVSDVPSVIKLLTRRKKIGESLKNEIYALRARKGVAGGIAACLLPETEIALTLKSNDMLEKTAVLGCARLIRAKLPVAEVGQIMNSSEGLLQTAAERYLISEDGTEARNLVLARHPNEAMILGARRSFMPGEREAEITPEVSELFFSVTGTYSYGSSETGSIDEFQGKLREEVKKNDGLTGIYALIENEKSGHKVLRIYKDKAVYTWHEDDARFFERTLTNEELNVIFRYVSETGLAESKPIVGTCYDGCDSSEFVMFGRAGGRRVHILGERSGDPVTRGLDMLFTKLEQGKAELHYHLQDKIDGLQVILADKDFPAKAVWKQGNDFRVLVTDEKFKKRIDKEISKSFDLEYSAFENAFDEDDEGYWERRTEILKRWNQKRLATENEPISWRTVSENKLQMETLSPPDMYLPYRGAKFPKIEELVSSDETWLARTPWFELRRGNYSKEGLWKVAPNGAEKLAVEGAFSSPVVSANGQWAVAGKQTEVGYFFDPYRIDLQTGKQYKIALAKSPWVSAVAFLPKFDSFLIKNQGLDEIGDASSYFRKSVEEAYGKDIFEQRKTTEYFLMNPATGVLKRVSGEFAPLLDISYRFLQASGKPDIYWAAIFDEEKNVTRIGQYDLSRFKFTEIMAVPEIKLSSMDIWVNESDEKVYFVYENHVLSLPLKTAPRK